MHRVGEPCWHVRQQAAEIQAHRCLMGKLGSELWKANASLIKKKKMHTHTHIWATREQMTS